LITGVYLIMLTVECYDWICMFLTSLYSRSFR